MSFYVPTDGVESWRRRLADPVLHWKKGRSAWALATCWEASGGFPPEVVSATNAYSEWGSRGLEFLVGFPEHQTPLAGGRRPSQSDILVVARSERGLVVMIVEGKVDEGFDQPVGRWLGSDPSEGKSRRLAFLCNHLGLEADDVGAFPYQLLHRTVSAVIEAGRFGGEPAMLVHSWGTLDGFDEYAAFLARLGAKAITDGFVTGRVPAGPISLGWVQGDPRWVTS